MSTQDIKNLEDRVEEIEGKLNMLCDSLNEAKGAWRFIKILGSFAIGSSMLITYLHTIKLDFFK